MFHPRFKNARFPHCQSCLDEDGKPETNGALINRKLGKLLKNKWSQPVEIKLSSHAETLLTLLKERLHASETEVIEEALLRLFHESQGESRA